jgi:hypothetical protein
MGLDLLKEITMKTYFIPENVLQGIITYLSTKPWNEVKDAMPVLTNLKEYIEPNKEE